ncbi:MAG: hypothetical protein ACE366_18645 [Bradymonadia bacterium]
MKALKILLPLYAAVGLAPFAQATPPLPENLPKLRQALEQGEWMSLPGRFLIHPALDAAWLKAATPLLEKGACGTSGGDDLHWLMSAKAPIGLALPFSPQDISAPRLWGWDPHRQCMLSFELPAAEGARTATEIDEPYVTERQVHRRYGVGQLQVRVSLIESRERPADAHSCETAHVLDRTWHVDDTGPIFTDKERANSDACNHEASIFDQFPHGRLATKALEPSIKSALSAARTARKTGDAKQESQRLSEAFEASKLPGPRHAGPYGELIIFHHVAQQPEQAWGAASQCLSLSGSRLTSAACLYNLARVAEDQISRAQATILYHASLQRRTHPAVRRRLNQLSVVPPAKKTPLALVAFLDQLERFHFDHPHARVKQLIPSKLPTWRAAAIQRYGPQAKCLRGRLELPEGDLMSWPHRHMPTAIHLPSALEATATPTLYWWDTSAACVKSVVLSGRPAVGTLASAAHVDDIERRHCAEDQMEDAETYELEFHHATAPRTMEMSGLEIAYGLDGITWQPKGGEADDGQAMIWDAPTAHDQHDNGCGGEEMSITLTPLAEGSVLVEAVHTSTGDPYNGSAEGSSKTMAILRSEGHTPLELSSASKSSSGDSLSSEEEASTEAEWTYLLGDDALVYTFSNTLSTTSTMAPPEDTDDAPKGVDEDDLEQICAGTFEAETSWVLGDVSINRSHTHEHKNCDF